MTPVKVDLVIEEVDGSPTSAMTSVVSAVEVIGCCRDEIGVDCTNCSHHLVRKVSSDELVGRMNDDGCCLPQRAGWTGERQREEDARRQLVYG